MIVVVGFQSESYDGCIQKANRWIQEHGSNNVRVISQTHQVLELQRCIMQYLTFTFEIREHGGDLLL
jgi:hypothetical protein